MMFATAVALELDQILQLESFGNSSEDWSKVFLINPGSISLKRIKNCSFLGEVYIGTFDSSINSSGINIPTGLYNSNFYNVCVLNNNCHVFNSAIVSDVYFGEFAAVIHCMSILGVHSLAKHGNNTVLTIGPENNNEGTSRNVVIDSRVTFAEVCQQVMGVETSTIAVIEMVNSTKLPESVGKHSLTVIGAHSSVTQCALIKNCSFATGTVVRSSTVVNTSTLQHATSQYEPHNNTSGVVISDSRVFDCIIHAQCSVEDGATVQSALLFSHSSVSHGALVSHSILASDSGVSRGECCHSVLGPFVGFHHASLLIATCWLLGRGNVGYGAMIGESSCQHDVLTSPLFSFIRRQPHGSFQRPGVHAWRGVLRGSGLGAQISLLFH
jgi:hypothetical protein